jgi:uncharacterized membrane protein
VKTRILYLLELFSAKFWVIPLICLVLSLLLAFLNNYFDRRLFALYRAPYSFLFDFNDPENIRALLTVTAGSILSVAGVSFSITIASLTLASQQFGPRLLRNFMQDKFNQVVIGVFIATFLYCVLVLQLTGTISEEKYTPVISMSTALVLIVANLLILVFFIHHIAISIQADTVIAGVHKDLDLRLNSLFPDKRDEPDAVPHPEIPADLQRRFEQDGESVYACQTGYLQAVDTEGLLKFLREKDMSLKLDCRPGDFIMRRSRLGLCLAPHGADGQMETAINDYLLVGDTRTAVQDAEYAIRQLVEVAVRALSPSVNDPFTAITCIDRLGNAIAFLMGRQLPATQYRDEDGKLRLQLIPPTFEGFVGAAFNQIRQNVSYHVAVVIRLLETVHSLAAQATTAEQAQVLMNQARDIHKSCEGKIDAQHDAEEVDSRFRAISRTLEPILR